MKGCLFFDIGNVLLQFDHKKMCAQIAQYCGVPVEGFYTLFFESGVGFDYELGKISSEEAFQKISTFAQKPLEANKLFKAASNIFEVKKQMYSLIESLKKRGHQLILLSNTCEAHFQFILSHFPIIRFFDKKILSYEVNLRKPDPKIYQKALELSDFPLDQCFYTDDILEYVLAAKKVGLDGTCFKNHTLLKKELIKKGFEVE